MMYKYIRDAWKNPDESYVRELMWQRVPVWRKQPAITRIDRPTRIDRARSLGYRAKKGFVVVRVKVRRGGRRKTRFKHGRRPKRMGVNKITMAKSIQRIGEERGVPQCPARVLPSRWGPGWQQHLRATLGTVVQAGRGQGRCAGIPVPLGPGARPDEPKAAPKSAG